MSPEAYRCLLSDRPLRPLNRLDFASDPYDEAELPLLCPDAQKIVEADNAGRRSLLSEVFAFEMLRRCEDATLVVLAYAPAHAAVVERAYYRVGPELRADTIVVVTTSDGDDEFLY